MAGWTMKGTMMEIFWRHNICHHRVLRRQRWIVPIFFLPRRAGIGYDVGVRESATTWSSIRSRLNGSNAGSLTSWALSFSGGGPNGLLPVFRTIQSTAVMRPFEIRSGLVRPTEKRAFMGVPSEAGLEPVELAGPPCLMLLAGTRCSGRTVRDEPTLSRRYLRNGRACRLSLQVRTLWRGVGMEVSSHSASISLAA